MHTHLLRVRVPFLETKDVSRQGDTDATNPGSAGRCCLVALVAVQLEALPELRQAQTNDSFA